MSRNSLKELESALVEKVSVLEAVRERLASGQRCIMEADTEGLDEETLKAQEGFDRLNSLNKKLMSILARSGEELGLPAKAQLTAIISSLEPDAKTRLHELQKRCFSIAGSIDLLLAMNDALLRNSLEIVGNSLSLFATFLRGEETYGAAGRMTNSGTAAGICREIKI